MQTYYAVLDGKQDKNEENNEVVVNSLKKYKRKMFILKIIVVILSIFIIAIWGSFIVERVKNNIQLNKDYEKGEYIFEIINTAYNKIEDIRKSDNYSIVEETTGISYDFKCIQEYSKTEMLYKDGYFKEKGTGDSGSINLGYNQNHNYTEYGVVAKDKSFNISLNDMSSNTSIGISKADYKYTYNFLEVFHKENVLEYKYFDIEEETIAGKDYYIVSKKYNIEYNAYNTEIWIDKENMLLFKSTYEKIGCQKTETKFTFSVNNVKDDDIRFDFVEENESSRKLMELYEKVRSGELGENDEQIIKWNSSEDCLKAVLNKNNKTNKEVIAQDKAGDKVIGNIKNEYGAKALSGYSYKGVIFDQNGDAYYTYKVYIYINEKEELEQNVFVSIFGDTIKTNEIEMEIKTGDMVIL